MALIIFVDEDQEKLNYIYKDRKNNHEPVAILNVTKRLVAVFFGYLMVVVVVMAAMVAAMDDFMIMCLKKIYNHHFK